MKKNDYIRCSHKDGMSQIFATFVSDNGTPSEPPTEVVISHPGLRASNVALLALDWKIERVLPMTPGSLIDFNGHRYVLLNTGWKAVGDGPELNSRADNVMREHTVLMDAAYFGPPA